jgi:hypothetical protein
MQFSFQHLIRRTFLIAAACMVVVVLLSPKVLAANNSGFSIQVSPSPLVLTLTPGQTHTAAVTVHNFGAQTETLKPLLKGLTMSGDSKTINFSTSISPDIAAWVHFQESQISVAPGTDQQLHVVYQVPHDAGFSYSFAIILERQQKMTPVPGAAAYEASVAVFNLININRSDAHQSLTVDTFGSDKGRYEFLPVSFSLKTHNNGNTISKPSGTIFIQRSPDDKEPLATLPVNDAEGYVLPDKSRTFVTAWNSGFPHFVTVKTSENGNPTLKLQWNWRELNQIRFGRYVAKAVVVYNDGKHDIPMVATKSFWVIPWRLMGILLLIIVVLLSGLLAIGLTAYKFIRKVRSRA